MTVWSTGCMYVWVWGVGVGGGEEDTLFIQY